MDRSVEVQLTHADGYRTLFQVVRLLQAERLI